MRFLEPANVEELANAFADHYRPLILTAAYVGLRWGELAGLGVEHVDPLRRQIRIERQLVEVSGAPTFGPPKTKAGRRTVSVPASLAQLLGEHMSSEPVRTSGLVFPTPSSTPMRRGNFNTLWRRLLDGTDRRPGVFRGTELEGLVFHELRHTAAALAIAQGAHPLAIKERLGHSSITVTMDTYGGLFPRIDEGSPRASRSSWPERGALTGAEWIALAISGAAWCSRSTRGSVASHHGARSGNRRGATRRGADRRRRVRA